MDEFIEHASVRIEHLTDRELLLLTAQSAKAMEAHLKKLNGRIGKAEEQIGELKQWQSSVDGSLKVGKIVIGSGGLFGIVAFILGWIRP